MNGLRYTGKVNNVSKFNRTVLQVVETTQIIRGRFKKIHRLLRFRQIQLKLYVTRTIKLKLVHHVFKMLLFSDPNAVRRGQISSSREEYQDDHAIMSIETMMKTLNLFHPVAESKELAIPSELLLNTIDFVNEHGGWTDELQIYIYESKITKVKFQLFVHGLTCL